MCNAQGCLSRVGDNAEDISAWDYGHLTVKGSKYLIEAIAPQLHLE